jgi:hypothetical protein
MKTKVETAKKIVISQDELREMGLLPSQVAKDLAHPGFYELPNYSVVSLFEVPVDQQPEEGAYHHSYPFIVRGKPIGYLNNILNLSDIVSDPRVRTAEGGLSAHPVMNVMPTIDFAKVGQALKDLKYVPAP